jgi:hypothetical protein
LAKDLVDEAFDKSNDKNYFSPFAKKAQENKKFYIGGKPDDITVIVAYVSINNNDFGFATSENTSTTDHDMRDSEYKEDM